MGRRLALFVPSLHGGGAERVMVTLAGAFAERGYPVDLVLVRAEGPYLAEVPDTVRVVNLRASRTFTSLPGLVRYLRRERPAAMLSAMDHANVVALWARRLAGAPERLLITVRTTSGERGTVAARPDGLVLGLTRTFYRWADGVLAVSQGVARDLVRTSGLPAERIQVVYNPVSQFELTRRAREPLEHPWFSEGSPPVLLSAGRLAPEKDFPTLIRAFAALRTRRRARLMILGEGSVRWDLERLVRALDVADDVELPGFDSNPFRYMSRAAVFVLASRREGLPNVLIQALACGAPVVATDCPSGPAEILEGGRWGRLVPVGNAERLAEAVEETLDTVERSSASSEALSRFSADPIAERYLELLGVR